MAECEREWGAPFDNLPDEIIINIFSYFSFTDLVDNVQNVCRRWKQLAHVPTLWFDKEYAIRGRRWKLQGRGCCGVLFSECRHCKCVKTDLELLQAVDTMPQLRRLTIMRAVRSHILRMICTGCPNLTNLQIQSSQNFHHSTVKHIFEKCPKIQKLILPASMLASRKFLELLAKLEHLTCLVVYEDLGNTVPVRLRILGDGCPRLKEIHTNWCYYDREEVEYFLQAKKHSLTSATLRWTSGLVGRWCLVNLLKECDTSLRKLRLVSFHVKPSMEAAAFEALGGLHTLEELHAEGIHAHQPKLLSLAFRPGCLPQLQRLQLQYATNLQDETMLAISRGCPNLCELRLRKSEYITDVGLSEIHRLKHLKILELTGCNGLGGTAIARVAQLPALHTLVLQLFNNLSVLQPGLRHVLSMKELRCLDILKSCDIKALPFDEFPEKLSHLRELRVTYARPDKSVVIQLQKIMPHLKVYNTYRYTDDDLAINDIEMDDGEPVDECYAGDDYYYGDNCYYGDDFGHAYEDDEETE